LIEQGKDVILMPALFLGASNDVVAPLGSQIRLGQEKLCRGKFEVADIQGNHWILHLQPQECNQELKTWLQNIDRSKRSKL